MVFWLTPPPSTVHVVYGCPLKARDHYFHVNCFTCVICHRQLMTGDQLFVLNDHLFVCKEDYYAGMYPIEENSFSISKQNKVF